MTTEEIDHVINFGALNYGPERMSNILNIPVDEIIKMFNDKNSLFYKSYKSGKDKFDYVIDMKLMEQAQSGDLKSLAKLEQRKMSLKNE